MATNFKKLKVKRWTTRARKVAFCAADKNMTLGPGEERIFEQLRLRKNPGAGKAAFPDALDRTGKPYAEIKSVSENYREKGGSVVVNLGQQEEFVKKVARLLWGKRRLRFEDGWRIAKEHLGLDFLTTNLSYAQWVSLQRNFLRSFLRAAGGRLILTSDDGYTVIDSSCLDRVSISALTSRGAVLLRVDRSCLPFI